MNAAPRLACAALALLTSAAAAPLSGQSPGARPAPGSEFPADPDAAPVPFGPGERLEYQVKLGFVSVGSAWLTISGVDTVRGNDTYTGSLEIKGGFLGLNLHDVYSSWFDVENLVSWRFIQDINDPGYKSFRHYEMFPERRRWERQDNDEFGTLGSALPLDDVGFLYFVRTLPLDIGKTYTFNRYFKQTGNPVILDVTGTDRREVPAGTFNTIVVRPTIRTSGIFDEGGKAELHFSDDERRVLVYLKVDMPLVGSMTLHLRSIQEGVPLNPEARAEALARREAQAAGGN